MEEDRSITDIAYDEYYKLQARVKELEKENNELLEHNKYLNDAIFKSLTNVKLANKQIELLLKLSKESEGE